MSSLDPTSAISNTYDSIRTSKVGLFDHLSTTSDTVINAFCGYWEKYSRYKRGWFRSIQSGSSRMQL